MWTRRKYLEGVAAAIMAFASASSSSAYSEKDPRPKLIKGNPSTVDFGHGLLIPLGSGAFHTLWEGDDRWMTFGHGFGPNEVSAMDQAEGSASGTMKLYLLTLAFAPERLTRINGGGWVLKSGKSSDLILGDIQIPGRPVMPHVDKLYDFAEGETGDESGAKVHAISAWSVWKKDVSLEDVRKTAVIP